MTTIKITKGDITEIPVDAIVNAANDTLLGGGGVDGAIHRAAGPEFLNECRSLKGCATGQAKITKGYNLPAKHVIHTVGPIYGSEEGKEAELLKLCYKNALELAHAHQLKTIAFPSISTGAFGYPIEEATIIATSAVKDYISSNPDHFECVTFVVFNDIVFGHYKRALAVS